MRHGSRACVIGMSRSPVRGLAGFSSWLQRGTDSTEHEAPRAATSTSRVYCGAGTFQEPTGQSARDKSGRERDTGARIVEVTQRGQSRAADHKLLTSALRYVISSRPQQNLRPDYRSGKTQVGHAARKYRHHRRDFHRWIKAEENEPSAARGEKNARVCAQRPRRARTSRANPRTSSSRMSRSTYRTAILSWSGR